MKKLLSILLVSLMIASMLMVGCSSEEEADNPTPEPTATEAPEADATEAPDAEDDILSGDFGDIGTLASYRMQLITRTEVNGAPYTTTLEMEVVNDPAPRAVHTVMSGITGSERDVETITIGPTIWVKAEDDMWMQLSVDEYDDTDQEYNDVADYLDFSDMSPTGEETVNGVHCQRYTIRSGITTGGSSLNVSGDVWIADESDLPPIIIKQISSWTLGSDEGSLVSEYEINITDINEPITVTAPSDDDIFDMTDIDSILEDMMGGIDDMLTE